MNTASTDRSMLWLHDRAEHDRLMRDDPEYRAEHERAIERARAEGEAQRAREQLQALHERRASALADIPLRADIEKRLVIGDELDATKALAAARRWLASPDVPPVLVLSGGTGSGKTVGAAWVRTRAVDQRSAGRWYSAAQLEALFRQLYDREALVEQSTARNVPLLVIDDLGAESDAARMTATLLELIDRRQHSSRRFRTLATTNLNRQDFAARYADARLASRMAPEAGIVAWVPCTDPDLRRRPTP